MPVDHPTLTPAQERARPVLPWDAGVEWMSDRLEYARIVRQQRRSPAWRLRTRRHFGPADEARVARMHWSGKRWPAGRRWLAEHDHGG